MLNLKMEYLGKTRKGWIVTLGRAKLCFSYATCVGVIAPDARVRLEGEWSKTSKRHIAAFGLDKCLEADAKLFNKLVVGVLSEELRRAR